MKKIIVAALSVILGTFGYTVVDTAIEHRVSNLESCVSSLEAAVESYHKVFETTTANTTRRTTTKPVTTTAPISTITTTTTTTTTSNNELNVGDFIPEDNDSQRKFLLRKYDGGAVRYISPDYLNGKVTTTVSTTPAYEDFYLYVTDASFQLTDIHEKNDATSWYNQNYDVVSSVKSQTLYDVKITLKGYTDSCFNNHTVDFDFSAWYSYFPGEYHAYILYPYRKSIVSNNICSNGSFEYVAIYTFKGKPPANFLFGIESIKVDWHNATTAAPTTTATPVSTTKESTTYPTSTTVAHVTTSQGVNVGGVFIDEHGYIVVN